MYQQQDKKMAAYLNSLAKIKETRSLQSLPLDVMCTVHQFKRVGTKFGKRITLELADHYVYLGARFNVLTDFQFDEYNSIAQKANLYLISRGFNGRTTNIEFEIQYNV